MVSALVFYKCTFGRWLYLHQFGVKRSFAERLLKCKSNFNSFILLLTITVKVLSKLTSDWMLVKVLPERHPIPWNTEWWKDNRCLCGGSSYSGIGQKNDKTLKRIKISKNTEIHWLYFEVSFVLYVASTRDRAVLTTKTYWMNRNLQNFLEFNKKKLIMLELFYRSRDVISIILPRNNRKIKYEIHFSMSCVFVDHENDKRLIMNRFMVNMTLYKLDKNNEGALQSIEGPQGLTPARRKKWSSYN